MSGTRDAGPRAAPRRRTSARRVAAAWTIAATLLGAGGCAKLLGIDDPDVVTNDGGEDGTTIDADAAPGPHDAGGEGEAARPHDGGDDAGDGGGTNADGAPGDSSAPVPPSCASAGPGRSDCGPLGNESCCASPLVTGGTYLRSYDGVTYTDPSYPATVSDFRLDRFEVTVGRFRLFAAAVANGWVPAVGSGRHTYLGGGGLNGGAETGWNPDWDADLADEGGTWLQVFGCGGDTSWTDGAQATDTRAMNCVDWFDAYAFCIWDGGFLPTEAEWNYAAAGGSDQRVYPWSQPADSGTIDCMYANIEPAGEASCQPELSAVGLESPFGDGAGNRWGQADLAGNAFEWALDFYETPYAVTSCVDCVDLTDTGERVLRGGSYVHPGTWAMTAYRGSFGSTEHTVDTGLRCARAP